jgi:hypothetical protein
VRLRRRDLIGRVRQRPHRTLSCFAGVSTAPTINQYGPNNQIALTASAAHPRRDNSFTPSSLRNRATQHQRSPTRLQCPQRGAHAPRMLWIDSRREVSCVTTARSSVTSPRGAIAHHAQPMRPRDEQRHHWCGLSPASLPRSPAPPRGCLGDLVSSGAVSAAGLPSAAVSAGYRAVQVFRPSPSWTSRKACTEGRGSVRRARGGWSTEAALAGRARDRRDRRRASSW